MKRNSAVITTGAALLALAIPVALGGCSANSSSANKPTASVTSISGIGYNEKDSPTVKVLTACAADAGVKFDWEFIPSASLNQKVLQRASAKTLPDIVMLNDQDLPKMAATGAFAPLSDFGLSTKGFTPGIVAGGKYEGKLYGIAPAVNTNALFYNKDILAAAGITPPTTWDELKTDAAKLTTGSQYGLAFTANQSFGIGTWAFLPFMWSNGGDEKNITSTKSVQALQFWTDLVKSGSVSSGSLTWAQGDVRDQFAAGKAAMMINGSWNVPPLDESGVNYGVATIPVPKAGDKLVAVQGGEYFTLPQTGNKAKQAKAAAVLKCLTSDKNQMALAEGNNYVPSRTSLATKFAAENPKLAAFTEEAKNIRARTSKLGEKWSDVDVQISTAIQSALTGQLSPADALKQAKNG